MGGDAGGGAGVDASVDAGAVVEAVEAADAGSHTAEPSALRSRFAWCVTGSGHFLEESLALAARLPQVDLFLSAAAEEVLPIYKIEVETLRPRFRIFRDKTASAVPVGMLYDDIYHTVVIAPATSNTVAKDRKSVV